MASTKVAFSHQRKFTSFDSSSLKMSCSIVGVGSDDDRAFLQSVLQAASAARNDPTACRPDGGFLPSRIQLWLSPDTGASAEYDFSARGAGAFLVCPRRTEFRTAVL